MLANGYSAGTREEYSGQALKKNIARDKVVSASKVYFNPDRLSSQECMNFRNVGVKMQQIALAWHWAKGVASPIAGAIDHNPAEGVMLLDEKK